MKPYYEHGGITIYPLEGLHSPCGAGAREIGIASSDQAVKPDAAERAAWRIVRGIWCVYPESNKYGDRCLKCNEPMGVDLGEDCIAGIAEVIREEYANGN